MRLTDLLRALTVYQIEHQSDVEITAVTADSRQVIPGALFVAYPGVNVDGVRFIPEAFHRGAAAIVVERPLSAADADPSLITANCSLIMVPNARAALAHLAAA